MKDGTKERMQDLFFSTGKLSTGSVTEYYKEVSNGNVTFTGEVFGPYTMSQTMSYYANDRKIITSTCRILLTSSEFGWSEPGPNVRDMAEEAFDAVSAEASQADWKVYDNDGNGYIDAFICVHAGEAVSSLRVANGIFLNHALCRPMRQVKAQIYGV